MMREHTCDVRIVSQEELLRLWQDPQSRLEWNCLFTTPPWLDAWWQSFAQPEDEPCRLMFCRQGEIVAVAALLLRGERARFMGAEDVCDYFDFTLAVAEPSE
ncbi:MAG: hypothetical protein D6773_11770, partial [Alphaproteobacteria bacterium]